jgi:hypothetical protein
MVGVAGPQFPLHDRNRCNLALMTQAQRYAAAVASIHTLAARKGYKIKPARPGRFAIYDLETGEQQVNNMALSDPSYFSLERALQWLHCRRDRSSRA